MVFSVCVCPHVSVCAVKVIKVSIRPEKSEANRWRKVDKEVKET